jgi:hypothetical protein
VDFTPALNDDGRHDKNLQDGGNTKGRRAHRVGRLAAALALNIVSFGALAQPDGQRLHELERQVEGSRRTIEELKGRVTELEARTTSTDAPAEHEHRIGIGLLLPPTPLRAFLDVGAGFSGESAGNKGFSVGALDFYLTPQLTANIKAVIELVFEHERTGELTADLERMQVGYSWSDAVTVWLGRFHTPLGYWNTAFHHGQQLQTSILRPQMIEFEDHGGVLPVHTVGVLGTGGMRTGNGRLTYDLYVGNAQSIEGRFLDPNNVGRSHPSYSTGLNLGYRFGGSPEGPRLGVHGYRGEVRDDAPSVNVTRVNIYGGYGAIDSSHWETIAEYYRFRNQDVSGGRGTFSSWAGFVQVGPRLGLWTVYGRAEKAALNQADPYFAALDGGRPYRRGALGVRYELSGNSALKAEFSRTHADNPAPDSFDQLLLQWAIRF